MGTVQYIKLTRHHIIDINVREDVVSLPDCISVENEPCDPAVDALGRPVSSLRVALPVNLLPTERL